MSVVDLLRRVVSGTGDGRRIDEPSEVIVQDDDERPLGGDADSLDAGVGVGAATEMPAASMGDVMSALEESAGADAGDAAFGLDMMAASDAAPAGVGLGAAYGGADGGAVPDVAAAFDAPTDAGGGEWGATVHMAAPPMGPVMADSDIRARLRALIRAMLREAV